MSERVIVCQVWWNELGVWLGMLPLPVGGSRHEAPHEISLSSRMQRDKVSTIGTSFAPRLIVVLRFFGLFQVIAVAVIVLVGVRAAWWWWWWQLAQRQRWALLTGAKWTTMRVPLLVNPLPTST